MSNPPFEKTIALASPTADEATEQPSTREKVSQATLLVEIGLETSALFQSGDGVAYADVTVRGHRETMAVRSRAYGQHLVRLFYEAYERAPTSQARADAVNLLEAHALFGGATHDVHLRYAELDGAIYVDLADDTWRAVKIDANGVSIVAEPPVRFRRARGMAALPAPVMAGGTLDDLRPLVNVGTSDDSFHLMLAWLVQCANPHGPFFVLVLQGEQGSAKSTVARVLRQMIDPSTAPLRRPPRDERDLMISANNNFVVTLDNLSGLSTVLSDAICCMSTGGAFGTRQLTTDADEVIFSAKRPVILNGIDELAERGDLQDRVLKLTLPRLDPAARKDEASLWSQFDQKLPALLGALYGAVSCALRNRSSVRLPSLPRMADAAIWIAAAEPALGVAEGTFMRAYARNSSDSIDATIGADPFGSTLQKFVQSLNAPWQGGAEKLLETLLTRAPQGVTHQPSWPKSANSLSNKLRRLAPAFRNRGVEFTFDLRDKTGRVLRITPATSGSRAAAAPTSPTAAQGATPDALEQLHDALISDYTARESGASPIPVINDTVGGGA